MGLKTIFTVLCILPVISQTALSFKFDFNVNGSGWESDNNAWHYSKDDGFPNNSAVPSFNYDGDYFWSQSTTMDSFLVSPAISINGKLTKIYFRYWFSTSDYTPDSGIYVYKIYSTYNVTIPLTTFSNNTDWSSLGVISCLDSPCCLFYPCAIKIGLGSSLGADEAGVAAVQCVSDEINACGGSIGTTSTTQTTSTTVSQITSTTPPVTTTVPTTTTEAPPTPIEIATIVMISITCALVIAIFVILLYYMFCRKKTVLSRD